MGKGLFMLKLKKNDLVELEITGYTAEGNGVGRAGGELAVFVDVYKRQVRSCACGFPGAALIMTACWAAGCPPCAA